MECDSTNLGESLGIVGECEELGIWEKAVRMTTDAEQWPRWKVNVTLNHQDADSLAYKYVKLSANDSIIQREWESGDNLDCLTCWHEVGGAAQQGMLARNGDIDGEDRHVVWQKFALAADEERTARAPPTNTPRANAKSFKALRKRLQESFNHQ